MQVRSFIKPSGASSRYIRLCKSVQDKGRLVKLNGENLDKELASYLTEAPDLDWYKSLYEYGEDAYKYFNAHQNSLAGFSGKATSKIMLFDFDSKNLEEAQEDTLNLLLKLDEFGIDVSESCRVYFSGNKGFHVEVYTNKDFEPEELKKTCELIAGDFKTFDNKVYNTTRLIRIKNTKHQKSGKYKVEIDPNFLQTKTTEEIKEYASQPNTTYSPVTPITDLSFIDQIKPKEKPKSVVVSGTSDESDYRGIERVDYSKMPKGMPRCLYTISQGVMPTGKGVRSELFLRLATYYRNQGFAKRLCYNLLKGVSALNAEIYPEQEKLGKEELYNTIIKSAYDGTFKVIMGATGTSKDNETLKSFCDGLDQHTQKSCSLHGSMALESKPIQIDEVFDSFKEFAQNFDKNSIKTGIGFIDEYMNLAVGTTTLLVGASGSGKSTLALNVMENANQNGLHTMFFSLDMHKNLVYLKLAQKLTNYSQKRILEIYKNRETAKIEEIKNAISSRYGKTYFDFTTAMTMEQMRDKIIETEQRTGNKIKLVVVDYASRIVSDKADAYANARYNAIKSTEVANVTDAAWIFISQISRNSGDGSTPIRTKRAAKDSGDWEESATNVITCWRPFMGDADNDDVMRLFLAKNRMGKELEEVLHWDGAKGIVRDMSTDEKVMYDETRGIEAEKEFQKAKYMSRS